MGAAPPVVARHAIFSDPEGYNRINGITASSTVTYVYANTSATVATSRKHTLTSITGARVDAFTYDVTGNTLTESAALATLSPSTGLLSTVATGSTLSYTTDAKNRASKVQIGITAANSVTYKINALGQRVQKTSASSYAYNTSSTVNATTGLSPQALTLNFNARYVYDEQGRLLGEYGPDGKLINETIWFDDLPVATLRPKGA